MRRNSRQILLTLSVLGFAFLILGSGNRAFYATTCSEFRVNILSEQKNYFLTTEVIRNMVRRAYGSPVEGSRIGQLDLRFIEQTVEENPYIKQAEVYADPGGRLTLDVIQKKPIFRIECNGRNKFYLDEDFERFPLSDNYSANAVILSGRFFSSCDNDSLFAQKSQYLKPLMKFISEDKFWESFISEMVIGKKGEIVIYPSIGNHKIILGNTADFKKKFRNLLHFYTQILNRGGWDKYSAIKLNFKGQVVAVKR